MKTFLTLFLLSLVSMAATETELKTIKQEKYYWVTAACQDDSFLRGCFQVDKSTCGSTVSKSFDGCWKFLEKKLSSSKFTLSESLRKFDSCVIRDVSLQHKEKALKTAVCELPSKEIL